MKVNSPSDADLILQKLRSDMGIHRNPRKGTLDAPKVLTDRLETGKSILVDEVFPDEFDLEETHRRIEKNTKDLAKYDKPILSVGGDHSVSFPVLKALKNRFPDMKLVWLDSHLDLKQKVGESISHDVVVRELLQNGFSEDDIAFVGITKIDKDEKAFLEEHDLEVYRAEELDKFLTEFNQKESTVYLSADIDVLKQDLAPGTGYPDGKLTVRDVEKIIDKVEPSHADLVEVAPPFDKDDKTVENAVKILKMLENSVQ